MQDKPDIDVIEGKGLCDKLLGTTGFDLIDVRTPEEHEAVHIDGSILIELKNLEDELDSLDTKRQYLIYCRSGVRSATAVRIMRAHGFNRTSNLMGGIIAWAACKFPTVLRK